MVNMFTIKSVFCNNFKYNFKSLKKSIKILDNKEMETLIKNIQKIVEE